MIREGDIVGWMFRRKIYVCLVYRFDGIDDHWVRLVTEKCLLSGGPARDDATALTYHTELIPVDWVNRHGDVIVSQDKADEVGKQIRAFLLTKKGKAMMQRPPREQTPPPESGYGNPQKVDLPTRVSKWGSSHLTAAMTARISDGGARRWSLTTLKRENIVMHNVFIDRETFGYSFAEIAARRNLTEGNARQIYFRGRNALKILHDSYPVAMRHEARQAEAA